MMIHTRFAYYWICFSVFICNWGCAIAQSASITVKTKTENQSVQELNCYWIEDNFEFFNHTPRQKYVAAYQGGRFTIPFDQNTTYRYITLQTEEKRDAIQPQLIDFLICPGDHIVIEGDARNGWTFSGTGAEKFTLQYQLAKIEASIFLPDNQSDDSLKIPKDNKLSSILRDELNEILRYNYVKRDSQIMLLSRYKNVLDSSIYNLLELNIIGKAEQSILKSLYLNFYRLSKEHPELAAEKSLFLKQYTKRNTRFHELPNRNLLHANGLQRYFVDRMKRKDWLGIAYDQEWTGNTITPSFMDRVCYKHFYLNYSKVDSAHRYAILSQISAPRYKDEIQSFLKNIANGALMPNFQLQDTLGNLVHLADFAGKIIILDFWYTGCGNCRILNKNMKPIKEDLKDRKDIIFVNVSVDKDFDEWKRSVYTQQYTDSSDVSLYTMGQKLEHPLIKFFNVVSFPRQVVIDKQRRIAEVQVPRAGNEENNSAFKRLIARLR